MCACEWRPGELVCLVPRGGRCRAGLSSLPAPPSSAPRRARDCREGRGGAAGEWGASRRRCRPTALSASLPPAVTQVARRRSPPGARRSDAHPRSLAGPPLLLAFAAAALDPPSHLGLHSGKALPPLSPASPPLARLLGEAGRKTFLPWKFWPFCGYSRLWARLSHQRQQQLLGSTPSLLEGSRPTLPTAPEVE